MRPWKHIGGGALLGCVLTLLALKAGRSLPAGDRAPNRETFAATLGPVRLTEGRMTGAAYAPYRTWPPRKEGSPSLQPERELLAKTGKQTPATIRDRGFLHLVSNNLDAAIADLEEAIQKAPGEASFLSDLSAVYGERAREKDQPEDYVASLEMADRALALKPDFAEAMFNRAVALEHLFLYTNASGAWGSYLENEPSMFPPLYTDSNSPWTAEARSHLRAMPPQRPVLPIWFVSALPMGEVRRFGIEFPHLTTETGEVTKASALSDEADRLESIGKSTEAWRYWYHALALSSQPTSISALRVSLRSLKGAVLASLAQRWSLAALDLQERALALAETGEPEQTVDALLDKARIEASLGKQQEARRDFSRALNCMHFVHQKREALAASFDVVQREIDESEDRSATIAMEQKPAAQLGALADLDFQRGDAASAEKKLGHALDELDRRRAMVTSGSDQRSFFDQAKALYMRMVALQLHLGKPEMALEFLERFRARSLLDQVNGDRGTSPLSWRDLSRRMPLQTAILIYAVIEDRLITWIVQPTGISVSLHQPAWTAISSTVQNISKQRGGLSDRSQSLEQLYRELVEPATKGLRAGDRIIFVPTRSLYSVPFAALRAPGSGRFLVQDHEVGVAPSVSEFLAAVERDRRLSSKPIASALLAGDPTMDRQAAMNLPASMPGAEKEIELLSTVYHGLDVQTLTRSAATPSRVLGSMGRYDIVHLAVHGQQDRDDPARSHLLLASEGEQSGVLSAKDLLATRLTRTRLVVLASCETQAGPVSESEGALSLTHAFLAAGAPAVVGSLWRVTDDSTQRLSIRFHQELLKGADALSALRTAQLEEISTHPQGSDWTWASFQVFGGVEARTPTLSP